MATLNSGPKAEFTDTLTVPRGDAPEVPSPLDHQSLRLPFSTTRGRTEERMEVRQQEGLPALQWEGKEVPSSPSSRPPGPPLLGLGIEWQGWGALSSWVISLRSQALRGGAAGLRKQRKVTGVVLTRGGADGPRGPGFGLEGGGDLIK